jgi:hypothetical protein
MGFGFANGARHSRMGSPAANGFGAPETSEKPGPSSLVAATIMPPGGISAGAPIHVVFPGCDGAPGRRANKRQGRQREA